MTSIVGGAVVVVGGLFGLRALDHAHGERYRAHLEEMHGKGISPCDYSGPMDMPPDRERVAAVGVGVVALLSLRYLARAARARCARAASSPGLLTFGLGLATFAWVWQRLEEDGRQFGDLILKPDGVPSEPSATLVGRIQATWVPGDRLRTFLLLAGLAACAGVLWRAVRTEGLPSSVLRRVGLTFAILGVACLALGVFRERTHTRGGAHWTLVRVVPEPRGPGQPVDIGNEDASGTDEPDGLRPLVGVGTAFVGLALLLTLAAQIHPDRAQPRFRRTSRPTTESP